MRRNIQPGTKVRNQSAPCIQKLRETDEPMYLRQHGRSAAVLLDVEAYEAMMDEIALLRDVRTSEEQVSAGKGSSHATTEKRLRARVEK